MGNAVCFHATIPRSFAVSVSPWMLGIDSNCGIRQEGLWSIFSRDGRSGRYPTALQFQGRGFGRGGGIRTIVISQVQCLPHTPDETGKALGGKTGSRKISISLSWFYISVDINSSRLFTRDYPRYHDKERRPTGDPKSTMIANQFEPFHCRCPSFLFCSNTENQDVITKFIPISP